MTEIEKVIRKIKDFSDGIMEGMSYNEIVSRLESFKKKLKEGEKKLNKEIKKWRIT